MNQKSLTVYILFYFIHATKQGRHRQGICGKATLTKERGQLSADQLQHRRSVTLHGALCARLGGRSTPIQKRKEEKESKQVTI